MGFLQDLKNCKGHRKEYRIKPALKLLVDKEDYAFSFAPTIVWQPWQYRYIDSYVVDICWLHFHIGIGIWQRKEYEDDI